MKPFEVRLAAEADAGSLLRLNEAFNGPGTNTLEKLRAGLMHNPDEIVAIAHTGEDVIGFCCGQVRHSMCYPEPAGEITELYVRPEHRRKGVAQMLMCFMEKALVERGVKTITLLTGDDNPGAQSFYRQKGYSASGEMHYEKSIGI